MVSKEKQNSILILDKLPSNIVKEAIIILSKEFDFEYDYNKAIKENVINEAEEVILDFIKKIEYEREKKSVGLLKKKYKISKLIILFLLFITIILLFSLIFLWSINKKI